MSTRGVRLTGTSRVFPPPDPNAPPIVPTKIFSSSSIVEKMMLNCSGCTTLQDIVNLDLSNRRISTLDPSVFSRMSSLVDLNLTNNRLTGFPLSLGLRHLKKLNCNSNLLKSVQTLEQFPNLEELHIDSNELTVADQYISVYMLPKLKVLNGKEVDLRETIMNMEETLQEQVHILWAESCAPLLKDPMSKAEIQMLEQQFIELLKNQVQFGPDALKDFTHHMLTVLAEKCVRQMTAHLRKIAEPSTPMSKVQIVVRNDASSSKASMSNGVGGQSGKAADKRQNQAQNSTGVEPASKKAKAVQNATPKAKVPKTTAKRKMIEAQKQGAGGSQKEAVIEIVVKQEEEPEVDMETEDSQDSNQECGIAYEPVHLLRCHSVNNDPTDAKTNVWKCAFEPNPEVPGSSKWTVATCGSNQVCVIDCNSGKVLKKYQHSKEKEEFYCIAWTKLGIITETYRRPTTVLAAAGVRGSIKLLHTTQLLCYAEIKVGGRTKPINCLLFHPTRPTWLFCGSEDITVVDIGIPHGPDLKIRHKKLFMLEAPGRCLGLVICPKSNFLMAGCDNGCYGWNLDPPKGGGKREKEHSMEFLLPSKARMLGDEEEIIDDDGEKEGDMIDGLALLKDDLIASKVACDGSIHVWSLSQSRKQQKKGSKEVTIDPLYTLEWCDSDSVYLDIGTWPGCGVLVSGDDQGEVWVYDVSKRSKTRSKKPVKPSQLLPWPENNEQEMSEIKDEDVVMTEMQEEQIVGVKIEEENKDGLKTEPVKASQAQSEVAKDVEIVQTAETAEMAVANVLEEVVSKVVGDDEKEPEVVALEEGQGAETKQKEEEEKQEEKEEDKEIEEKEEKKQEDAVQDGATEEKDGTPVEVKDAEQSEKEGTAEQKEVAEGAEQEKEREGEKAEEETDKEKQDIEEKERDTTENDAAEEQKDTSEEQKEDKEEEKAEEAEGGVRRGRRRRTTPKKFEEPEPVVEKSRGRGRPRKLLPAEEEKMKAQETEKAEQVAAGVVRGRGRPRKSQEPESPAVSQSAKVKREQKMQESARLKAEKAEQAAKQKAEKAEQAAKVKAEKAEQAAKLKAEKKAASLAAKEEKAQEKAQEKAKKAKERAELAELRQSLKKTKKGEEDLMDIANNEDRIIVNDVAISSDCKFIVSVTNKNLICIWQRV